MSTSDLLTLMRWLSPAFPLGSFAYSSGLAQAHAEGVLNSQEDLSKALTYLVTQGSVWVDAVTLSEALDGQDMRAEALALAASSERAQEVLDQGRAFQKTLATSDGIELAAGPYLPLLGEAARDLELSKSTVIAAYLQAYVANLVTIAVRLIPLGQSQGQAVLKELEPVITRTSERAVNSSIEDAGSSSFAFDCMSMDHEAQEVRLFRS